MAICYNRLWKLMIDKGYNKTQVCEQAKISTNAMAKMGRNDCTLDDIVELIPDETKI